MKNKIIFIIIILLVFMILLIPLMGSYAFYSDNKDLNIINTKVGDWKSTLGYLRMKDKNNNLSPTIQGDMYRYQGTDNVANWICFGTTENCGKNDDDIEKYMYRIIGITEEGQLKLLKETFVKEKGINGFAWNSVYHLHECNGGICEWPNANLYKRLNGTSNGEVQGAGSCSPTCDGANTDIFVDSEYYDYLKSGDNVNGTKDEKGSTWYQLIANHDWMYGDTITEYDNEDTYTGDAVYAIETGQIETTHYIQNPEDLATVVEEQYKWPKTNNIISKINLMYIHDYVYSYYDGKNPDTRGNPKNYNTAKNGWLFFQKDGYNTSLNYEWLGTRWGYLNTNETVVNERYVYNSGYVSCFPVYFGFGVRPVFYLIPDIKIKNGTTGTKTNPFIIEHELLNS